MREARLKSFDRLIMVVLLLAAPIVWLLCVILRRQRSGVALIRPGGMGDLICLEMAMEHTPLKETETTYLIDGRSAAWAGYRRLNAIRYDINTISVLLKYAGRFDTIIVTEQLFGSAAAFGLLLAGGKRSHVYGFSTQRGRIALGHNVPYSPTDEHEVSCFSRLLNLATGGHQPTPLPEENLLRPRRFAVESDALWVSIAGQGVPSREVDLLTFTQMIRLTAKGRRIVITAQPSDVPFSQQMVSMLDNASVFKGSFGELCESLSRAEEVLTVDGGMVHVCSFFGIPTRTLFTAGVVEKWHPLAEHSQVALVPGNLPCRPCTRFGQVPACPIGYACKAFPADIFA